MLQSALKRRAPTIASNRLRWERRMFDHAIKSHMLRFNRAASFDLLDAGGKKVARDRALSRDELKSFFQAMRTTRGFSVENALTVKLEHRANHRLCR